MNLMIYLGLTLLVRQSVVAAPQRVSGFEIVVNNKKSRQNTWFIATPFPQDHNPWTPWDYGSVRYVREINPSTPIWLEYTVEEDPGFFRSWRTAYAGYGFQSLCDMKRDPKNFDIPDLVRRYIGFPKNCFVAKGTIRYPESFLGASSIKNLPIPAGYVNKNIRISVSLWNGDDKKTLLFTGDFHLNNIARKRKGYMLQKFIGMRG